MVQIWAEPLVAAEKNSKFSAGNIATSNEMKLFSQERWERGNTECTPSVSAAAVTQEENLSLPSSYVPWLL